MRQLVYALHFAGRSVPTGAAGTDLKVAVNAPSCEMSTVVGPRGVTASMVPVPGDEATFESEMVFTGSTTFLEIGTICFGTAGNRLRFSSLGSGYLGPCLDPHLRHGTVMLRIDGGDGQFADASGLITSNFTIDGDGVVNDHHLGVIMIA